MNQEFISPSSKQSATTGINTIRIYNPIKQSQKQDLGDNLFEDGYRTCSLNDEMIHTPWLLDEPPKNYPVPIVDEQEARKMLQVYCTVSKSS